MEMCESGVNHANMVDIPWHRDQLSGMITTSVVLKSRKSWFQTDDLFNPLYRKEVEEEKGENA